MRFYECFALAALIARTTYPQINRKYYSICLTAKRLYVILRSVKLISFTEHGISFSLYGGSHGKKRLDVHAS